MSDEENQGAGARRAATGKAGGKIPSEGQAAREDRLAEALRANLRRRKDQASARRDGGSAASGGVADTDDGKEDERQG